MVSGPIIRRGARDWNANTPTSSSRWTSADAATALRMSTLHRRRRRRLGDESEIGDAGTTQARDQFDDRAVGHAAIGLEVHGPLGGAGVAEGGFELRDRHDAI